LGKRVVGDGRVLPKGIQQFLTGDQTIAIFEEVHQDGESFGLEVHLRVVGRAQDAAS
jgi:hypothetical protein